MDHDQVGLRPTRRVTDHAISIPSGLALDLLGTAIDLSTLAVHIREMYPAAARTLESHSAKLRAFAEAANR
jgi:hypothetical protein